MVLEAFSWAQIRPFEIRLNQVNHTSAFAFVYLISNPNDFLDNY